MDVKLEKALEEIIEDKTFSLTAVEAIKELRGDHKNLVISLVKQDAINKNLKVEAADRDQTISELRDRLLVWTAREHELLKRESEVTKLEKSEAVERGKAHVLGHCFDTVFRNTIFRESFNKNVPNGVDQYGNSQTAFESGDISRTTEPEQP